MSTTATLVYAAIALLVGVLEPPLEVAWKCRTGFEATEACVWGGALLPVGRVIGVVIIAPITFTVLTGIAYTWRGLRRQRVTR